MPHAKWTKAQFWAELDESGEEVVRERIVTKKYAYEKLALAQEWVDQRERDRKEASNREQITIAREAAEAARDSADAARDAADEAREANRLARQANTIARVAIAVAAMAAITSITALFS